MSSSATGTPSTRIVPCKTTPCSSAPGGAVTGAAGGGGGGGVAGPGDGTTGTSSELPESVGLAEGDADATTDGLALGETTMLGEGAGDGLALARAVGGGAT